ncbi:hypothetical protein BSK62_29495 [Paenibacillus odorifer]|nr:MULTISPECIES: DUF2785 domain-containing protein [unclassified Paenibacillus]MDH6426703.1 hypothetical protein [Paenibacillus sp. PastH-4]MDH6526561.1 hypothetical protein [Paenibacillus sp. PastH-3]OMD57863.1 hypothetical protein BSK62_29495 [Paenibacillus odorifer]
MINSREQLMIDLQRIEENDYELRSGEDIKDYVKLMLEHIGDPEPVLRDELIYSTFYKWINEKRWFNDAELRELLWILLDEQHLFYHIGNKEDLTVYTRTFSVLVVALILQRHREKVILDSSEFIKVKQGLIRYYEEERDLRGYMEKEGWAHAAAHGADALDELVLCSESDAEVREEVLAVIQKMLYNDQYIFREEEDERIATIIVTIIDHHLLLQQSITDWILNLAQCGSWPRSHSQYVNRINTKNFLRSLYFRLLLTEKNMDIVDVLLKTEKNLNEFVH